MVDRFDEHRVVSSVFSNVAHFNKWYKNYSLGIDDLCFLRGGSSWDPSGDEFSTGDRVVETRTRKMLK